MLLSAAAARSLPKIERGFQLADFFNKIGQRRTFEPLMNECQLSAPAPRKQSAG
jgi:hypothetical protein